MIFTSMLVFLRRRVTPAHFSAQNLCRLLVLVCWAAISPLGASDVAKVKFEVPAGGADKTLKVFAKQAQREIIFPVKPLAGVKTNTVQGEYSVTEALERLLAGTELTVREDEKTGGLIIRRRDDPNAPRAALNAASVRPLANPSLRENDETIELSPFFVATDRDIGWVASSTLVGSRTNEELKNVPLSVDALTNEFMRDVNAFTLDDAARWVAGLDVASPLELRHEENSLYYRGMSVGNREAGGSTRNFFLWYAPTDNYNIERIDFNKGSNSLMFGDASPGGQTATYTKQPRFKNFGEFVGQYASYKTYRVQVDINRKISERAAFRLNLVERATRAYIDFSDSQFRGADLAAVYRATPTTTVRLEAEAGRFARRNASNSVGILANAAPGRGFSLLNRWYCTSDGDIVQRTATNPPLAEDRGGASGDILSLLEGQAQDISLPNGVIKKFHGFNKSLNLLGANDYLNRPYTVVSGWIEQRFGRLTIELAYNQQNQHQDRNDAPFSTVINVDSAGRPYTEAGSYQPKLFGNRVKIGRATASYPFELGKWAKQYLVVTAAKQQDYAYSRRWQLANMATALPGSNLVTMRVYLDNPGIFSRSYWEQFVPEKLPTTATFRPGMFEISDANRPPIDVRYQATQSASLSGSYLNGRLHTLVGVRHDAFSRKRLVNIPKDTSGQIIILGDPDSAPSAYAYDPLSDLSSTTKSAGLSLAVFKNTNVYTSYSESFRWQNAQAFDGQILGPVTGKTYEVGLKGTLWKQALTYTAAAYRTDRANDPFRWTPDLLNQVQLEDLFNPNNVLATDPEYFHVANGVVSERNTVLSSQHAEGYEATVLFQRTYGVQARVMFAYNKITAERDFSHFERLLQSAIERTTTANAPGGNRAMAESAAFIANAQQILAANLGVSAVTGTASKPYSANFLCDYQFSEGTALRGLRVALSGSWRSDYNLSILKGVTYKGDAELPLSAYAIYRRKLLGYSTSFRLGISNFYDLVHGNGKFRRSGISAVRNSGELIYSYRYIYPVNWNLTTTVEF